MARSKKLTYFQPQAGTRHIVIEDYHKHWEEARPWGWELRIAHGDSVLKIDLKWKTYRRAGMLTEEKNNDLRYKRNRRPNKQRKSKSSA
jgi:hypothetical protein